VSDFPRPVVMRCDDPEAEMWRHIDITALPSTVQAALRHKYGDSLGGRLVDDKVSGFGQCVRQAKEYFRAASAISSDTAPVLCYYGVFQLAAALLIANSRNATLRTLPRRHGVTPR